MDRLAIKKVGVLALVSFLFVCIVVVAVAAAHPEKPVPAANLAANSTSVSASTSPPSRALATSSVVVVMPSLSVSVQPPTIIQGDPVVVVVNGLSPLSSSATSIPATMTFAGMPLPVVVYKSKPTAFIGIDLNKKPGTYVLKVTLSDGRILQKNIVVNARKKVVASLGIPAALGGNTPAAATNLVTSLTDDNATLAALPSAAMSFWTGAFVFPVADPVVTDVYGYVRQTGAYEIAHKGVDFQAPPGTPVMAINTGVVTYAGPLGIYGNTIVLDHGLGLESFYMHLSEIDVKKGEMVERSQVVGASGETGYAEGPHLHLTVRVGGVSIDPMVFLKFFQ